MSEIINLNDSQRQFSRHYTFYIEVKNPFDIYFSFRPNFSFGEVYQEKLDEITNNLINKSLGETIDARKLYTKIIKELAEWFNPLGIGIIIDSNVEKIFEKQDKERYLRLEYTETFKNHLISERPSFEEWKNW
jgi:hypothetical protein